MQRGDRSGLNPHPRIAITEPTNRSVRAMRRKSANSVRNAAALIGRAASKAARGDPPPTFWEGIDFASAFELPIVFLSDLSSRASSRRRFRTFDRREGV